MGREIEWEARSVEWKENELFVMKAVKGMPAKFNMQLKIRFESLGIERTRVTVIFDFHAPYPLVGGLIDQFYLRKEVQRLVNSAINGMMKAANEHRIPAVDSQFEKRKADHPGYSMSEISSYAHVNQLAKI